MKKNNPRGYELRNETQNDKMKCPNHNGSLVKCLCDHFHAKYIQTTYKSISVPFLQFQSYFVAQKMKITVKNQYFSIVRNLQ